MAPFLLVSAPTKMTAQLLMFRGQVLARKELGRIRKLFRDHPRATLSELSIRVCEVFEWRLPTGRVADRSCRRFLRKLEALGIVELPPSAAATAARFKFATSSERKREGVRPSEIPWPPATTDEGDPGELVVRPIRREERGPWEGIMEKHHYLVCPPLVLSLAHCKDRGDAVSKRSEVRRRPGMGGNVTSPGPDDSFCQPGWRTARAERFRGGGNADCVVALA